MLRLHDFFPTLFLEILHQSSQSLLSLSKGHRSLSKDLLVTFGLLPTNKVNEEISGSYKSQAAHKQTDGQKVAATGYVGLLPGETRYMGDCHIFISVCML